MENYKIDKNRLSKKEIYIPIAFWTIIFAILCFYLQYKSAFHFFFIEQESIFLYDKSFLLSTFLKPGGFVQLIYEYCVQYFIYPYFGACLMSFILTLIGVLTYGTIRQIVRNRSLLILSTLPIVSLLIIHLNVNYYYTGIIAYLIALLALFFHLKIKNTLWRVFYSVIVSSFLFWCTGPVAILYAACAFLLEIFSNFKKSYLFVIPLLFVLLLGVFSVYHSLISEYYFAFLPDNYFNHRLNPGKAIYLSWICLPTILLIACLLRNVKEPKGLYKILGISFQLIIVFIAFWYGTTKLTPEKSEFFKELDYYLRNEQWDKIIKRCSEEKTNNYLYKCCLNIALAEKGELGNRLFEFDQQGWQGIYPTWNKVPYISMFLCDEYFSMGHIAYSQCMAFQANESALVANPRALKRLIQTNLIYGAYPVAEKYISMLEKTKFYKDWAHNQRKFLNNDATIEQDSLLGLKRHCIIPKDCFSGMDGICTDLERIAEHNPSHKASIEYAGAMFLLTKDTEGIKDMLEKYYGTEVLPTLPKSFQEAVFTFAEKDTATWNHYKIPESEINQYSEYHKSFKEARRTNYIEPLKRNFGNTYWYYFLFKKID